MLGECPESGSNVLRAKKPTCYGTSVGKPRNEESYATEKDHHFFPLLYDIFNHMDLGKIPALPLAYNK